MVPGVLGKFGRAYDQLTSVTKNDVTKNSVTTAKIRKHFSFVVSKVLTSYLPGITLQDVVACLIIDFNQMGGVHVKIMMKFLSTHHVLINM